MTDLRRNDKGIKTYLNYFTGMLVEISAILFIALVSLIIIGLIASWYR